ncbi:hypothetical protein B0A77_07175 [Flavobacterium branchiophilum]|uniref:Uncharacterized protein n=1 Tax=Flavobacterium branchiophilum TaxID=55197 RepID=A0A2H3KBZ7_9FLAO|nr:hypothetical protein B0A77_07175 [Flavobacterium branchiophilum]
MVFFFSISRNLPSEANSRVRDSSGNPFFGWVRAFSARAPPKKRLFHNIIFHLEFNERCLERIARPLGNAQKNSCFWLVVFFLEIGPKTKPETNKLLIIYFDIK